MEPELRRRLRGAVYRGDGPEVVDVLQGATFADALQLAGDGLLALRSARAPPAPTRWRCCASQSFASAAGRATRSSPDT